MQKSVAFIFFVTGILLLSACQPPVGEATKAQQQKSSKMSSAGSTKSTVQTAGSTQTTKKTEKKKAPQQKPKPKKKRPTFALFGGQKECPKYHQTIKAGEKTVCRPPDVCKESELGNAECSANKQSLLTCGIYKDNDGNEQFGWLSELCANKCATVKGESVCSKCQKKFRCYFDAEEYDPDYYTTVSIGHYTPGKGTLMTSCHPITGKYLKKVKRCGYHCNKLQGEDACWTGSKYESGDSDGGSGSGGGGGGGQGGEGSLGSRGTGGGSTGSGKMDRGSASESSKTESGSTGTSRSSSAESQTGEDGGYVMIGETKCPRKDPIDGSCRGCAAKCRANALAALA